VRLYVIVSIFILLASPYAQAASVEREASSILMRNRLRNNSELFKFLKSELMNDPNFIRLVNQDNHDGVKKYVQSVLKSEVMSALRNKSYPHDRFFALLPYIESETGGSIQYGFRPRQGRARVSQRKDFDPFYLKTRNELYKRYKELMKQDPGIFLAFRSSGADAIMDDYDFEEFINKKISKLNAKEEVDFYLSVLERFPKSEDAQEFFDAWLRSLIDDHLKKSKQIASLSGRLPRNAYSDAGKMYVDAFIQLHQSYFQMPRDSPKRKEIYAILDHIGQFVEVMPPTEGLIIEYAMAQANSEQAFHNVQKMADYLYSGRKYSNPSDPMINMPDFKYDLDPKSKRISDRLFHQVIEHKMKRVMSGEVDSIGFSLYDQLIQDDPQLAKMYVNAFTKYEFVPGLKTRDHAAVLRVSEFIGQHADPSIKSSMVARLEMLHNSLEKQYLLKERVHKIIPALGVSSESSAELIFHYLEPNEFLKDPRSLKIVQDNLASLPFIHNLKQSDDVLLLFGDRYDLLSQRVESIFSDFSKLPPKVHDLPALEALMKAYVEHPGAKPESVRRATHLWKSVFYGRNAPTEAGSPVRVRSKQFISWINQKAKKWDLEGRWLVKDYRMIDQGVDPCSKGEIKSFLSKFFTKN
jgi:hypothetical protein